jgi:hypothetical protein
MVVLAPECYVEWINNHVGFNPRGQAHSDYLTARIVADLRGSCPRIDDEFARMELDLKHNVGLNGQRHTLSAALAAASQGEGEDGDVDPNIDGVVLRTGWGLTGSGLAAPIAIENKTIMTAHGKARTNRWNDARAYAEHVHRSSPATIAAFTIIINTASTYRNPDEFARSAKSSGKNAGTAAARTIDLFRLMPLRSMPDDHVGRCEAALILAVSYDGVTPTARLVESAPAPSPGEPFSYDWFLDRLCRLYAERN